MKTQLRHSRGFTVVELVMAMAVGVVLLAAISTAVVSGQRSSTGIERKVTTNQDARAALEIMAAEIRMASYNPYLNSAPGGGAPLTWLNPDNCGAGNPLYRGIQRARDGEIVVEMDIQGAIAPCAGVNDSCSDASINNGSSNEIVRYAYDNVNQRIERQVISCNAGTRSATTDATQLAFLGPIAGRPDVRTVLVTNGTALPVFRYFRANGTPLNPAGTPMTDALIPDIRRIEIVLLVESADVDPSTGQPRRMAYSTSVIPRNHGIFIAGF
jgi:prepilin-type N-terminal cleavage/methylation domain-containing protein